MSLLIQAFSPRNEVNSVANTRVQYSSIAPVSIRITASVLGNSGVNQNRSQRSNKNPTNNDPAIHAAFAFIVIPPMNSLHVHRQPGGATGRLSLFLTESFGSLGRVLRLVSATGDIRATLPVLSDSALSRAAEGFATRAGGGIVSGGPSGASRPWSNNTIYRPLVIQRDRITDVVDEVGDQMLDPANRNVLALVFMFQVIATIDCRTCS